LRNLIQTKINSLMLLKKRIRRRRKKTSKSILYELFSSSIEKDVFNIFIYLFKDSERHKQTRTHFSECSLSMHGLAVDRISFPIPCDFSRKAVACHQSNHRNKSPYLRPCTYSRSIVCCMFYI
jgi:hypothetical protein